LQVLAITGNASLVVALGSMMRDWEVVTVRSADEAVEQGSPSMVALIDMGETNQGIEIADEMYRRGLGIPGVVIGDVGAEHPRISVLVRPFSLEDLGIAVRQASQRPMADAEPEREASVAPPAPAAPPSEKQPPHPRVPQKPDIQPAPAPAAHAAAAAATAKSPEPAITPPKTLAPEPAGKRALSVVRPVDEETIEAPVDEPAAAVEESTVPVEEPPDAEEPPVTVEEQPAVEPSVNVAEEIQPEPTEYEQRHAPGSVYEPEPRQRVSIPSPLPEGRRRLLRRTTRPVRPARPAASVATPDEPLLVKHLRVAARNLKDLEALLTELPFLDDLRSMAAALVSEVEALFEPQTVAVFAPGEDGYQPIAYSGLSRVEAGMVVPPTQPLFSDVISTKDGILIQPVDLAQGLVAGIGGARTEAMMASPAVLDDEVVAVIVVGSEHFEETDLDRLSEMAAEAAPGLAVALRLNELRARGGSV
jgi:hypothetical protein